MSLYLQRDVNCVCLCSNENTQLFNNHFLLDILRTKYPENIMSMVFSMLCNRRSNRRVTLFVNMFCASSEEM